MVRTYLPAKAFTPLAVDLRQSQAWKTYLESLGWETIVVAGQVALRLRRLPLIGSIIKVQRPENLEPKVIEEIDRVARQNRALFVKIEPIDSQDIPALTAAGYRPDSWPLLPSRTIIIDLIPPLEEIKQRFSKDARQSLRKVERHRLRVVSYPNQSGEEVAEVLPAFARLLGETGQRQKFYATNLKDLQAKAQALGSNAHLVLAYQDNNLVAGALMAINQPTAHYLHAASSPQGRELLAQYAVVWEMIKITRELGGQRLDLEGIYDPRFPKMTKKWRGFTVFKQKFGGQKAAFPPSYTKYYSPLVRLIFSLGSLLG